MLWECVALIVMVFGVLFPLEPLWVSPFQSEPLMIPLNELFGELLTPISDVLDHVPTREAVEHELPCEWFANSSVATEELASHGHDATSSAAGNHTHGITTGTNTDSPYNMVSTQAKYANTTRYTDSSGNHTHTINIGSTGGNQRHENRPPYTVINRWKRTN